ncbi:MAG: diadenylate cyclase [Planctomycetaceae bacterium]
MIQPEVPPVLLTLLKAARRIAEENNAVAVVMLAERAYDFQALQKLLRKTRLIVTSEREDVQAAAEQADVALVALSREPETRQNQLTQALLDAIVDEKLETGDRIVALYSGFEHGAVDSLSVIKLSEHLAKLTSRDLQKLDTKVPLKTLRQVVDLAVEIGREGREGKPVGALFVVGNHRKVLSMSHEQIHDPFRGYGASDCELKNRTVRESIKELAQIDGAFVVSSEGVVVAAGRILDAPQEGLTLSKGLGARHWSAAAISKATDAIAIAVSESTGTVRLFQNGIVCLRVEPMDRAMTWRDVETEPPAAD